MGIIAVRGAITVKENSEEEILNNTKLLINEIINKNEIDINNVISILFSATEDLNKVYPAKAARELGFTNCGLMCFQEMNVEGSMKKCIRILILFDGAKEQSEVIHVYLKDAVKLRPDLIL